MFLKRLSARLWKREKYTNALAEWLDNNIREMLRQELEDKDLVNIVNPLDDERRLVVETNFIRKSAIITNPHLKLLFEDRWIDHVKSFNVTASIPRPRDEKLDLLFLAAYDEPWPTLGFKDIRDGVIQGAAIQFFEAIDAFARANR